MKGHQDSHATMVLEHDAWLNIEADQLAHQYLLSTESLSGPLQYMLPGSQWVCLGSRSQMVKQLQD